MKEAFKGRTFGSENLGLINECSDIIESYVGQGLKLTLRQLYYQLVTKNIIPNVEKSYSKLSSVVSAARLAGHLDWDAIEDRIRVPVIPAEWSSIESIVESALYSYRLPRWADQPHYIELWVEKDALAGVLRPLANKYHIPMMVNRGYSSQSAMYEASKRFLSRQNEGKTLVLLYLGDLDPSGEDMVRDIQDRMDMFGVRMLVDKIALTMKQVQEYQPPPNPAKRSDPRSKDFVAKYGGSSWEVDAINPTELRKIITTNIELYIDHLLMGRVIQKENLDKERLREATKKIMQEG